MKVIKPDWVGHGKMPIYSVDISPDDLRFATCGRGDGSGKIIIWNMGPLLSEELDADSNIPKVLYQLDVHVGCVNCVRWNPDGMLLASCSDDKTVMIYRKSSSSPLLYKGFLKQMEVWRIVGTLSAHKSDVLDIAWAPKQPWVASCSVDNTVIVWDVDNMSSLVQLKGHLGLVKGVSWDPLGQYLSSQSNDKTLKVWRTKDWREEISFSKPFVQSSDMTLVTRGDWSPDGNYIVGSNAWNSGGPVACIVPVVRPFPSNEDDLNDGIMDFVGHRKAVTCVKFHPGLWKKKGDDAKYCVLGTGSRDCSVAIWRTADTRPVCVFKNFFSSSVSDLCWTRKGQCLIACSPDGGVAAFHFDEGELGTLCSDDEKTKLLLSIYGETVVKGNSVVRCIVETPDILMSNDDVKISDKTDVSIRPASVNQLVAETSKNDTTDVCSAAEKITNGVHKETLVNSSNNSNEPVGSEDIAELKQVERRTADGKRRITPITLPKDIVLPATKIQVVIEEGTEEPSPLKHRVDDCPPPKRLCLSKEPAVLSNVDSRKGRLTDTTRRSQLIGRSLLPVPEIGLTPLSVRSGSIISIGENGDYIEVIEVSPIFVLRRHSRGKANPTWQYPCNGIVTALACNTTYTVVACSSPITLQFLCSKTGWPKHLPILLPGVPSYLTLTNDNKTFVVTTHGHLHVYSETKLLISVPSLRGCLITDSGQLVSVSNCRLNDSGIVIVSLANGKTISWSKDDGVWLLISDRNSTVWNIGREGSTENNQLKKGRRFGVKNGSKCTAAYLHQEITAAKALGFAVKYRVSLLELVRFYSQEEELLQLRHLLENVKNCDGQELLTECLTVIKNYGVCQRLYVEYSGSLDFDDITKSP